MEITVDKTMKKYWQGYSLVSEKYYTSVFVTANGAIDISGSDSGSGSTETNSVCLI
jgi:hypothetical protein